MILIPSTQILRAASCQQRKPLGGTITLGEAIAFAEKEFTK